MRRVSDGRKLLRWQRTSVIGAPGKARGGETRKKKKDKEKEKEKEKGKAASAAPARKSHLCRTSVVREVHWRSPSSKIPTSSTSVAREAHFRTLQHTFPYTKYSSVAPARTSAVRKSQLFSTSTRQTSTTPACSCALRAAPGQFPPKARADARLRASCHWRLASHCAKISGCCNNTKQKKLLMAMDECSRSTSQGMGRSSVWTLCG